MWMKGGWGISGLMGERVSAAVKGPLSYPQTDPWTTEEACDGAESWHWGAWHKASEKNTPLLLTSFSLPLDFRCSTPSSLSDWADDTFATPAPLFPLGSEPCLCYKSPELSTLSCFPALSSDVIFPISLFPYQTTVISPEHQTRNSGSPEEYPYTHVGVFLDSWKASVDPELKNDGGKRMAPRVKNRGPGPAPPFAQLCPFQHAQLSPATLWSGQSGSSSAGTGKGGLNLVITSTGDGVAGCCWSLVPWRQGY